MQRILYISESRFAEADAELVVSQIVAHAQAKNAQFGLSGALIFTGKHFAQVLEGPPEAITVVMAHIYNDPRHANIVVIDKSPITHRHFPGWQMAYQGPSQFVSRHITKLLQATARSERQRASEWLTELALEFSTTSAAVK